jgi:Holliday junction resolvasome RuvABC endonuclease subunit
MIVLGIDQSYTQIGISVVEGTKVGNGKILSVKSYKYKKLKTKSEKRAFVKRLVHAFVEKYEPDLVLVERIRTFSQNFISVPYIKATGALIAVIIDEVFPQDVWSVETRSWKARVCGTAKGMHRQDKGVSVRYINERYGRMLNDDEADSVCIALYGLSKINRKMLRKEE